MWVYTLHNISIYIYKYKYMYIYIYTYLYACNTYFDISTINPKVIGAMFVNLAELKSRSMQSNKISIFVDKLKPIMFPLRFWCGSSLFPHGLLSTKLNWDLGRWAPECLGDTEIQWDNMGYR